MTLNGKVVVVTGASSGIGRAVAIEMARRGATLFLAARRPSELESVAELCRERGASATGRVDVLINNAGYAIFDSIAGARPDELEDMMATNYFGTVWCTQAVLPQMLARGEGTIVNVSSIAGIMGYARMGGYCATKFAVIGFTEALRNEVLPRGVRVALVCPGTTETEFFAKAERGKMPGASRLILGVSAERVARVICRSAGDGKYRRIVPLAAALYMRMKEIFPRLAHLLMRRVSALLER
jgi:short-subunit dehydrogenase